MTGASLAAPSAAGPVRLLLDDGPVSAEGGGVVMIPQRTPQEAAGEARAIESLERWQASQQPAPTLLERATGVVADVGVVVILVVAVLAAGVCTAALVARLRHRAARHRDPVKSAGAAMAGKLGLTPRSRELCAQLAEAHGNASPVAIMVSPSAMRAATSRLRERDPQAAAKAERLIASIHG